MLAQAMCMWSTIAFLTVSEYNVEKLNGVLLTMSDRLPINLLFSDKLCVEAGEL
jgi:hypothetical protein